MNDLNEELIKAAVAEYLQQEAQKFDGRMTLRGPGLRVLVFTGDEADEANAEDKDEKEEDEHS